MDQKYHVVIKRKVTTIRRPWKGAEVELYSSSGRPKDGVSAMFGAHEVRQFLETLGPFVVIAIDDPQIARGIIDEGYYDVEDPDTHEVSRWYKGGFYIRDEGTVLIMVPQPMEIVEFFGHLKLKIDLEDNWGNCYKVGKYLKRLFSHHRSVMCGKVVSEIDDNGVIIVKLDNGKSLHVRYANWGKLVDGMNLISSHCMKMLGLKGTPGAGARITALANDFSKGHAIVLNNLDHDLVLFNSKPLLHGEEFFFAIDWLHTGNLFTDVQSVINFQMDKGSFLEDWSEKFFNEVGEALKSDEKLKTMLGFYEVDFHRSRDDGDFIEKDKDWSLLRAMRADVDHRTHPALLHKMFHLFIDKIMNCETDIRIPVPAKVGGALYAMVDPTIFDNNGDPILDGQLKGTQVYCKAFNGPVVYHRQPNGHRSEHCVGDAVPNLLLESMDHGCFMFISKDTIIGELQRLGGGDQDDRLVYYTDRDVVNHFRMLPPYPLVKFEEKINPTRKFNRFSHLLPREKPVYDWHQALVMLDQLAKQRVHIGYVVNAIIHDTVLSDNIDDIILDVQQQVPSQKRDISLLWLEEYRKFKNRLAEVTSKLELVIDGVKKEGKDLSDIGDKVKHFNDELQVVCHFTTIGGKFGGRVPSSRRGENHPVVAFCNIDRVMERIRGMRAEFENIVVDMSWQLMPPIPLDILTQPTIPGSEALAKAIRSYYGALWAEARPEIDAAGEDDFKKVIINKYKLIDDKTADEFGKHPMIVDAFVELYKLVYSDRKPEAPRDENGKCETYHDGILWGPRLSRFTIHALELCDMAGRFTHAELDSAFRRQGRETINVKIEDGDVTLEGVNEVIGKIDPMADGTKVLEHGLAYVKAFNAYPYVPEPKINAYVVESIDPLGDAKAWKSHTHRHVTLVPDESGRVAVMLDNKTLFGYLAEDDASYITKVTGGFLAPDKRANILEVLVTRQ